MRSYLIALPFIAVLLFTACPGPGPGNHPYPGLSIQNPLNQDQSLPIVFFDQPAVQLFGGSGFGSSVTWTLSGLGQIQDAKGNPITTVAAGTPVYYLPPASGPPGSNATLTVIGSDQYGGNSTSNLTLRLVEPSQVVFSVYSSTRLRGSPLAPGDQDNIQAWPTPMPANPQIELVLQAVDPPDGDPGTLILSTNTRDPFNPIVATYKAPAQVLAKRSVRITGTFWDPWNQKTLSSTWPIDIIPK